MSVYRSKFVSISSSDSSENFNPLTLNAKFGNQSFKTFSGFSFSQISFINNFYNVTSKKNTLKVLIPNNLNVEEPYTIIIEPGYYFHTDVAETIKTKVKEIQPSGNYDMNVISFNNFKYKTEGFKIVPYIVDRTSTLSLILGFVDETVIQIAGPVLDGYQYASQENRLNWNQIAYLHSYNLKSGNSLTSTGTNSNIVAAIPLDTGIGSPVFLTDHVAVTFPHHLFHNRKDITDIDFSLRDIDNNIMECSNNNVVIILRLFY
jgi:hypothetical protein